MGVSIYWYIVVAVIGLGMILPQEGKEKKYYIFLMTIIHTFVCGWRYMYLTGDLRKYAYGYYQYNENRALGWFDEKVFHAGRNAGFEWVKKAFSMATDGDFQIFLIAMAIFTQLAVAILIYRYSPKPWLSYLVWNCMAFYITYDFSAIKQGLAMAVLMYAMIAIFEKKKILFLVLVLLAGFIHAPAFVFLPAYFISNAKITDKTIIAYVIVVMVVFIFKQQIAEWGTDIYYEDGVVDTGKAISIGGRFAVIVLIILCGLLLRGFRERQFESLFSIMIIAAIIQLFSGYDNVFTRFADYYLQFTVLYIPMIFYKPDHITPKNEKADTPPFLFDADSMNFFVVILTVVLIWWYNITCVGTAIGHETNNYTNYRFMWEVEDETIDIEEIENTQF